MITGEPNELDKRSDARDPAERGLEGLAGQAPASADDLKALLKPFPAERLRAYPVSAEER